MKEKKRVLVVDDEKVVCDMLKKFLTKKGYKVSISLNGEDAIRKTEKVKPHVILLDIKMPSMDGIEVLKRIREFYKEIVIVMITAIKNNGIGQRCMELGADDYITKPISLDYLENVLLVKLLKFEK